MRKKQKTWIKKRHFFVFKVLHPFFKWNIKKRYNLTVVDCEKKVPSPALVMSNHLTTLDPFMLSLSFKRPIYFIASDDLFTIPVLSPIIKFLVAPIPKSKSKSDLSTIRNTVRVLKEGGTVAVFPEGNRSLSGGNWNIDISTAKLAKMCKVPLVLYNVKGGYGADPRWGRGVRKGKMICGVKKIISAEELSKMSVDEIYKEIVNNLVSDDYKWDIAFKSKHRAEYLERALYYCENCKSFNTIQSKNQKVYCKKCGFSAQYGENLKFENINGKIAGETVKEWFDKQRVELEKKTKSIDGVLFYDKKVQARLIYDRKRHALGAAELCAIRDGVTVNLKKGVAYDLSFQTLYGATILGKRKINFYLPDDKTLQIKGNKRFNSVKYLHLYEMFKEKYG